MIFRFPLFFLFSLLIVVSNAQPLIRLNNEDKKFIGKYTKVLEDPSGKLTINDVIQSNSTFKVVDADVFNSSPSRSAFWIKFNLKNELDIPVFIEIDNPTIKELEIYSVEGSKINLVAKSGTSLLFSEREVLRNTFIIRLDLLPGENKTYYIRYTSSVIMGLPICIGTAEVLMGRNHIEDLAFGTFFGILLVTILYNFFLFLSIRDITYLSYVGYMTGFAVLQGALLGYFFRIFPNSPVLMSHLPFIAGSATGIFSIIFTQYFLQTKNRTPLFHNIGLVLISSFSFGIIVNSFNSQLGENIIDISGLFLAAYMLVVGIVAYYKGYKPARYYLLATIFSLASVFIYILKGLNLVPYTEITNNIMLIGIAIEAILFSFALGDRYKIIEKENEKIQSELNDELRSKVEERTKAQAELTQSNKRLKTINKDLDNFIYTASHDLRAPISNLEGLLIMLKDSKDEEEKATVIQFMTESVEKFKDTIMELTEISKVQRETFEDIQKIEFEKLAKDTSALFSQQIQKEKIKITYDFKQAPSICFSKKNLKSIFYNLLSNAIKYQAENRKAEISIQSKTLKDFILLTFKDNGIGIPQEQFDIIFKMFKRYHTHVEGTGVGLYIIKRIVENSGGKIEIDSKVGEGSEFRIYLKNQNQELLNDQSNSINYSTI